MQTQLSKNFYLEELLASPTAVAKGYTEQFAPPTEVTNSLRELVTHVLQPLRDAIGVTIIVSSGYRCPRVNRSVGGVGNSQHMTGEAADINAAGYSVEQLYQYIRHSRIPYDQLIQEYDHWVHISWAGQVPLQRMQCLRYTTKGNSIDNTPINHL